MCVCWVCRLQQTSRQLASSAAVSSRLSCTSPHASLLARRHAAGRRRRGRGRGRRGGGRVREGEGEASTSSLQHDARSESWLFMQHFFSLLATHYVGSADRFHVAFFPLLHMMCVVQVGFSCIIFCYTRCDKKSLHVSLCSVFRCPLQSVFYAAFFDRVGL